MKNQLPTGMVLNNPTNMALKYMVKFVPPIYVKPDESSTDVLIFGKNEEKTQNDNEKGLARFGGIWRTPNYLYSYLRAAKILVNDAICTEKLDDLALPIFYIQRHTTELVLKRLLKWCYDISKQRNELGEPCLEILSSRSKNNLNRSHNLRVLLEDLEKISVDHGFARPPKSIYKLVGLLSKYELTETWSRYSTSMKNEATLHHVESECVVPIKEIQSTLELVISECVYSKLENKGVYEYLMYEEWFSQARKLDDVG
jgi:hypothetical protein